MSEQTLDIGRRNIVVINLPEKIIVSKVRPVSQSAREYGGS